ncbi:hypothetical protein ABEF82_14790 [Acinetobacter thermotolerans]|uniref:hypothetical protein n=1 Tax=Acinetobacter thermotolerans TaxID=3151487 RepID=UPI00325B2FDE
MKNNPSLKKYDAGDMGDAHNLAKDDLWWMVTALQHVTKEIKSLAEAAQANGAKGVYFDSLLTHLSMYEYLAQERYDSHEKFSEEYFAEWQKDKESLNIKVVA